MKMKTMKKNYTEPVTNVTEVELEGFVCVSIDVIKMQVEVDEFVNAGNVYTDEEIVF